MEQHTVLDRLKMQLQKDYFNDNDDVYSTLLIENDLNPNDIYNHKTMQKQLLQTILNVFNTLANNIDLFRTIETEFVTTTAAYEALQDRMNRIEKQLCTIPDAEGETSGMFASLFYDY